MRETPGRTTHCGFCKIRAAPRQRKGCASNIFPGCQRPGGRLLFPDPISNVPNCCHSSPNPALQEKTQRRSHPIRAVPRLLYPHARVVRAFRDCVATSYRFAAVGRRGQNPAPNGAKELSPALQRWVKWKMRPSPVGTAQFSHTPFRAVPQTMCPVCSGSAALNLDYS